MGRAKATPGRSAAGRPARREPAEPDDWTADEREPTQRETEHGARMGSLMLRIALLRHGAARGLPNLSPEQCSAILRMVAGSREGRRAARLLEAAVAGEGNGAAGRRRRPHPITRKRPSRGAASKWETRNDGTRG